ncbi:FAD-binding oxidoreductase [Inquilinus sp. CAU 1745]|uniref:NAD(P)/FAD-dependent oxidoreductase n=1 Tax=Inquilinus sp. CAU 1745 TaxID=3140369 RepID=UPI00325C2AA9
MTAETADAIVLGGGMAGASAAAFLAGRARTLVLEAEAQPGYHSTGRSAAIFIQNYGNRAIRSLTAASRSFFENPPAGFAEHSLLGPRGSLHLAFEGQEEALDDLVAGGNGMDRITADEALRLAPRVKRDRLIGAAYEPDSTDIDVNALHLGFLKAMREAGGRVVTDARVGRMTRNGGVWRVETPAGIFEAPIVINAAGAWADTVAALAGARPVGLVPCRRTAIVVDARDGDDVSRWPLTGDVAESFYFKPESGRIMISPADETPVEPHDVQAEEMDIAVAVDRFTNAVDIPVRRIAHRWAGLRTFAPDRTPVVGYDPEAEGFFWLAGQGGYGIQTSPAMGMLAGALVLGESVPHDLTRAGVDPAALSPGRFSTLEE